jgi:hypothetical protein
VSRAESRPAGRASFGSRDFGSGRRRWCSVARNFFGATLISFEEDEGKSMARGWESKGGEASQSSADRKGDQGLDLKAEERERHRKRSSLELDRRRVLQQIEDSSSEARRAALRQALSFLEEELAKLEFRESDGLDP